AAEAAGEERDGNAEVWAQRLTQAADAGRAAGLGIGTAMAGFADLPDARVPWERRLRGLLNRAVSEIPRRSWKRPANRWVAREAVAMAAGGPRNGDGPVFEPGYARDRMRPRIAVAIDTSSSITETQLRLFGAEALAIARKSGAEIHLLAFDEAVHLNVRLETAAQLEALTFRRDGGTSFIDVVETAATLAPSILVVLTDLDAAFGDPPDFPVIWAATGAAPPPPFGTLLRVDL
ncbi:MAG: VWA-like domain-containing protein, partial [Pseudomonadota bacterium]